MKTNKSKKVGKLMVMMVVLIVSALAVRAAILHDYGGEDTTVNVRQAIVFEEKEDNTPVTHEFDVFGGCCKCVKDKIVSRACIDGIIDLQTSYYIYNEVTETYEIDTGEGIETTIYEVPEYTTLALNNKDTAWVEIDGDGIEGTLVFQTMKLNFDYTLDAMGLIPETEYSLIYYADPWAGNHPGALIGTFTSDDCGIISASDNINLGMNLPQEEDDNHLLGAKLWLVLADDYDEVTHEMTNWNMGDYLFEHELVAYSDCNQEVECWLAPLLGTLITDDIVIPAEKTVGLVFCNQFAINIEAGKYLVSTKAIPVLP